MKKIALLMITLIGGFGLAKNCTSCLTTPSETTSKPSKNEKGSVDGDVSIQKNCTSC